MSPIFHLSIPVSNLQASCNFYEKVLGANVGRINEDWLDIWVLGGPVTLQYMLRQ